MTSREKIRFRRWSMSSPKAKQNIQKMHQNKKKKRSIKKTESEE